MTALVTSLFVVSILAQAGELKVMTSGATTAAHLALAPAFEKASAHKVATLATSTGLGQGSIANRVRRGEAVDVVMLARAALDELIASKHVVAASRVDLARSKVGMAVRAGAPRPDISTVDALKKTLLAAKSVAISSQVSGLYLSNELFPRLGIADVMKPKTIMATGRAGAVLADGKADIAFQQVSELLEIPGIVLVGELPADVQRVTVFSAGIVAGAKNEAAARAYLAFFTSETGRRAMAKSGLEPM
jgi:molybdate transport system substrate-binding protein